MRELLKPWCTRCLEEAVENQVLRELAHSSSNTLQDLLREMKFGHLPSLRDKAGQHANQRLEDRKQQLRDYEERMQRSEEELSLQAVDSLLQGEAWEEIAQRIAQDQLRQELEEKLQALKAQPEELSAEDIEKALEELVQQGYLDMEGGRFKFTPRGAMRLASQVLKRILEKLANLDLGAHNIREMGYGSQLALSSRKLEFGDDYSLVHIEKTLLNSLERAQPQDESIELELDDFEVHELTQQTRMCSGLILDESGSMQGEKLRAAIDASLALAQLVNREAKDSMKVILFSDQVRQMPIWEVLNNTFSGGTTDIRAALRTFRREARKEKGDKQAYLITDTEPNTQDGRYVGFDMAAAGVLEEAWRFRQEGITLNIIMLSQSPNLKLLASKLAQKSLGRVFFTTPLNLGEVMVEDYLTVRRKACRSRR